MPGDEDRAIGVYDSGVGGVSVLRALRVALPDESFVYVADSGHAPYGDRPPEFLAGRARAVADFLGARRVKAMVLACNTVSVIAARALRERHAIPIVAMEPAIKPAVEATRSKVVLVLGTTNTIRSEPVARLCEQFRDRARIVLQACPGLVERVERGDLESPALRSLLTEYLRPGLDEGADTVVLGCTHYAFLSDAIRAIAGPDVAVVEPSAAIARQLSRRLAEVAQPATRAGRATVFHTSGDVEALRSFLDTVNEPHAEISPLPALD
ncbi:MAG: glutamate racemase [Steroidobacteraceae bacterium]